MNTFLKMGVALWLACLTAGAAWADRGWHRPYGSVHLGVYVGPPWGYVHAPPYWPVYIPPTVIVAPPPAPTFYVEQSPPARAAVPVLEAGYWYYCQEAGAYYPHVKQCAGDWRKVSPVPAN